MVGHGFGSRSFAQAFTGKSPDYEPKALRAAAVEELKKLQESAKGNDKEGPKEWYSDPVTTVVDHEVWSQDGCKRSETFDAFFKPNGEIVHCTSAQMDTLIGRFTEMGTKGLDGVTDLRKPIREIEDLFISTYAGQIIANQAMDFHKQDGVTEIEESVEANPVDAHLSDVLLEDEKAGVVDVNRAPAFVGCVSNFSNFLDLFRKTLRLLEVGVPCIVLSRSNTTQHHYRWFQILDKLLAERNVDKRMLCYVSADIEQQRRLMQALGANSALYFTGSRPVAEKIKEVCPRLMASTGGPNTMLAANGVTPGVAQAIRWSVGIENSGQCTAMRHLVAPGVSKDDVEKLFSEGMDKIETSVDALTTSGFSGVFNGWAESFEGELAKVKETQSPEYTQHPSGLAVAYKVAKGDSFPYGIQENWRRLFLDVTSADSADEVHKAEYIAKLAKWLTVEQPIVLAINGDSKEKGYPIARALFEQTAQVVYSVGETVEDAASADFSACLTCQARPQDGEIFGEFPPRKELTKYTRFPVTVPSSTAGYNSQYSQDFLAKQAASTEATSTAALTGVMASEHAKGYVRVLEQFLVEATEENPRVSPLHKRGPHRTAMWGVQRPPLTGVKNVIRAGAATTVDEVAVYLAPFYLTNARDQAVISCDPANAAVAKAFSGIAGIELVSEDDAAATARGADAWNVVDLTKLDTKFGTEEFPLAGNFVSLVFPLGHIKSAKANDKDFEAALKASPKWLKMFK